MPGQSEAHLRAGHHARASETNCRIDTMPIAEQALPGSVISWISFLADLLAADFLRQSSLSQDAS